MKWLSLFMLLFLVGCQHTPKKVVVDNYVLIKVECEDFGRIDPVDALPVVFVNAKTDEGFNVLGLRGDMYSNLAITIRETLRYIEEQKTAIDYYKGCIARHNAITLNEEGEPQ
jgi:hypothetical protein